MKKKGLLALLLVLLISGSVIAYLKITENNKSNTENVSKITEENNNDTTKDVVKDTLNESINEKDIEIKKETDKEKIVITKKDVVSKSDNEINKELIIENNKENSVEKKKDKTNEVPVESEKVKPKETVLETKNESVKEIISETQKEMAIETQKETKKEVDLETHKEIAIETKNETQNEANPVIKNYEFKKNKYPYIEGYGFSPLMEYFAKKIVREDYIFPIEEIEFFAGKDFNSKNHNQKESIINTEFDKAIQHNFSVKNDIRFIEFGEIIKVENPPIQRVSEKLSYINNKIKELISGIDYKNMSKREISIVAFDIVIDYLDYDYDLYEIVNMSNDQDKLLEMSDEEFQRFIDDMNSRTTVYSALKTGKGVCTEFASLYTLLARAMGLEAIVVDGELYDISDPEMKNIPLYHSWVNVKMDDGKWYLVDPTFSDNFEGEEKYQWLNLANNSKDIRVPFIYVTYPNNFKLGYSDKYSIY